MNQIGFILDDLNAGQLPYCSILACNNWLTNHSDTNFVIFFQDECLPCIFPKFARFNIRDIPLFKGHLIATSLSTLPLLKYGFLAQKYFYIYNYNEICDPNKDKSKLTEILANIDITKFSRSIDYNEDIVKRFNVQGLSKIIVPDCNIDKILEIVNDNSRNETRTT